MGTVNASLIRHGQCVNLVNKLYFVVCHPKAVWLSYSGVGLVIYPNISGLGLP